MVLRIIERKNSNWGNKEKKIHLFLNRGLNLMLKIPL